jgi:hypothetical protein
MLAKKLITSVIPFSRSAKFLQLPNQPSRPLHAGLRIKEPKKKLYPAG